MSVNVYGKFLNKRQIGNKVAWVQTDLTRAASDLVNEHILRTATDYGRDAEYLDYRIAEQLDDELKSYFSVAPNFLNKQEWNQNSYKIVPLSLKVENKDGFIATLTKFENNLLYKYFPVVIECKSIPWELLEWKWDFQHKYSELNLSEELKEELNSVFKKKKKPVYGNDITKIIRSIYDKKPRMFVFNDFLEMCENIVKVKGSMHNFNIRVGSSVYEAKERFMYNKKLSSISGRLYSQKYTPINKNTKPYLLSDLHCLTEKDVAATLSTFEGQLKKIKDDSIEQVVIKTLNRTGWTQFKDCDELEDEDCEYVEELELVVDELKFMLKLFERMKEDESNYSDIESCYIFQVI